MTNTELASNLQALGLSDTPKTAWETPAFAVLDTREETEHGHHVGGDSDAHS